MVQFTSEVIPTWNDWYNRGCVIEAVLCTIGIFVIVGVEYAKKTEFPTFSGDRKEKSRKQAYEQRPGSTEFPPDGSQPGTTVGGSTAKKNEEVEESEEDLDPIHQMFLLMTIHVISIGFAMRNSVNGYGLLLCYLHLLLFAANLYFLVSLINTLILEEWGGVSGFEVDFEHLYAFWLVLYLWCSFCCVFLKFLSFCC